MDRPDPWLRTTDVAEELGITDETVRRLIHARLLRATVIVTGERRIFRVRRSDLEAFRRAHTRDSVSDDWE
jgi:excisionase family DNA binding protein